jgi:hypothetical protein
MSTLNEEELLDNAKVFVDGQIEQEEDGVDNLAWYVLQAWKMHPEVKRTDLDYLTESEQEKYDNT